MFAQSTLEPRALNAEQFKLYELAHQAIFRYQGQGPALAGCARCQRKFFTLSKLFAPLSIGVNIALCDGCLVASIEDGTTHV